MEIIEDILTLLNDDKLTPKERSTIQKRIDIDREKMREYNKGYLDFKYMHYLNLSTQRGSVYKKSSFLFDITNRAIGVLSIPDDKSEEFYKTLSIAYDEMSELSNVYLLDDSVVSNSLTAIKDVYRKQFEDSDKKDILADQLDEAFGRIRTNISIAISKNVMHRLVLEPILHKHFKDFSFELSHDETSWNGIEFDTASGGGFGCRTTFESLTYKTEEHGEDLKENFFCSLAVYFMDVRRAKQTYSYKELILKEKKVFNEKTLANIADGIRAIKIANYE